MDKYDKAIEYARELGAQHGRNAVSWLDIDETNAARILDGITDGDPAILDILPFPDLSGEWADSLTGPQLVTDACESAGIEPHSPAHGAANLDWFTDICDAYETAFSENVETAITERCHYHLND